MLRWQLATIVVINLRTLCCRKSIDSTDNVRTHPMDLGIPCAGRLVNYLVTVMSRSHLA
jgi:hypothetical protein